MAQSIIPSLGVLVFVLGLICLGEAAKGWDNSICSTRSTGDQLPPIPDIFEMEIEANIVDKTKTINLREFADSTAAINKAAIEETIAVGAYYNDSLTSLSQFNFQTNQQFTVVPQVNEAPMCFVKDLSKSTDRFLFGEKTPANNGKSHFSVSGAWRLSKDFPAQKMTDTPTIRGIPSTHYQNCIYLSSMDATMKADWYFSQPGWHNSLGTPTVPLRLEVTGNIWNSTSQARSIQHIYEIVNFRDFIPDTTREVAFKVPLNTVCIGMKSLSPLPTIPESFSFRAEVIRSGVGGLISYFRAFFDTRVRMVRYDYFPQPDIGNSWGGATEITEVHDYNTGHAYIMDRVRGNCTISPIDLGSSDAIATDPSHVRMGSFGDFFGLNNGVLNWTYTGTRMLRGLKADSYINLVKDYPKVLAAKNPDKTFFATWQMSFLNQGDIQVSGNKIQTADPVQINIVSGASPEYNAVYNIIDFDEEEPDPRSFHIAQCFNSATTRVPLQFKIMAPFDPIVTQNKQAVQLLTLISLIGYMAISPIRVSNLNLDIAPDNNILASFDLLAAPPKPGDLCKGCPREVIIDLDTAIFVLNKTITSGDFVIGDDTKDGQTLAYMGLKVDSDSLQRRRDGIDNTITEKVVQLDVGEAVGLSIGLFLVGIILATVVLAVIYKVKGPSVMSTISFTPGTYEGGARE